MLKTSFSLILAFVMCLSLAACGKSGVPEVVPETENTVVSKEDRTQEINESKPELQV